MQQLKNGNNLTGGDIQCTVETFTQLTLSTPPAPPILPTRSPGPVGQASFHEQVKEYVNGQTSWKKISKVCGVIFGANPVMQSTPTLRLYLPLR